MSEQVRTPYAMSGTDLRYGATRCAVLTCAILLRGVWYCPTLYRGTDLGDLRYAAMPTKAMLIRDIL
eukprot:232067-Rhodomonas_salina.1